MKPTDVAMNDNSQAGKQGEELNIQELDGVAGGVLRQPLPEPLPGYNDPIPDAV